MTTLRRLATAVRRLPARTPLRVKLVATLCLLVLGALAATGAVATTELRSYLLDRVDSQLVSAAHGPVGEHDHGPGDGGRSPEADNQFQPPSAYYIQDLDSLGNPGQVRARPDTAEGSAPVVPHLDAQQVSSRAGRPFTVASTAGGAGWRVVVTPQSNGTGSTLVGTSLADLNNTVGRLALLLALIGASALLLIGVTGYLLVRRSLRPLAEVEATAAAIAGGDLTQRVPDAYPGTEVGRLSAALNGMLSQLESAFTAQATSEAAARASEERMRRFVADASHELRTPLTSIRGFAELHRQGAVTGHNEIARAMRRIEGEAARMGLLVEDLLLLARLDEQRPLERLPVDLVALAADAVHDAQVVGSDHVVRLDVGEVDVGAAPPIVIGDEPRLRQVVSNLVRNALVHTPPGTTVTVRVGRPRDADGDDWAQLEVADDGPGMAPAQAERIFERFFRADPSRTRSSGGSGLGLSIVAALTAAHGGTVHVETGPGAGTTFRIRLPVPADPPPVRAPEVDAAASGGVGPVG